MKKPAEPIRFPQSPDSCYTGSSSGNFAHEIDLLAEETGGKEHFISMCRASAHPDVMELVRLWERLSKDAQGVG